MNHHRALAYCLRMILSENRFALFATRPFGPDHALEIVAVGTL
ncbi:hypothetical protein SAMN05216338_1011118 [Bradyrhizobium sp. Rc2d]|nr:hypothetical protein SAMN05216338_1011118 [Bradyrhizobium sp. Rc2d]